ncbi:MAG TPA: hypothetical protein VJN70_05880 [Gemmatimonadaceae bacterium]|nr:hypothetical protein [Gemmatimonadaceae bacterium]
MPNDIAFSYRTARSPAIASAIGAVVAIESIAVHFAVAARHPRVAWALTLTMIAALVWLVRDYRALGSGFIRLEAPRRVRLTAGIHREVRRVALKLDDPETFLRTLEQHRAALSARPA